MLWPAFESFLRRLLAPEVALDTAAVQSSVDSGVGDAERKGEGKRRTHLCFHKVRESGNVESITAPYDVHPDVLYRCNPTVLLEEGVVGWFSIIPSCDQTPKGVLFPFSTPSMQTSVARLLRG
ncbi:hypothetical protein TraAM80_08250 [Trypanosoma rangeli]|uniref:Uncharacterized protein n=1 Tax=Trypanosoma rangeli TaxID=5698 RepID=A0A3R7LL49_TRYRA|nr:uncharacterized protein TraAM80_08250 [Trypanosoma rangeli]RNE99339.1 hypothetical protein TraAM80_08250 [Trypanosoma rangeli]|eukprot:RNE99339.1 hypothetical protein TraAM80_08250 [Trypanosoma rangeli]